MSLLVDIASIHAYLRYTVVSANRPTLIVFQ